MDLMRDIAMINKVFCGKAEEILKEFPSNFIDLTVTSPPYDNLRTYNGYHFNFQEIAKELYRVTKPGGVIVWIVGDATINGTETGTSFKQALYFKEIDFNLHDTMIYQKSNPMPNNHRRYVPAFEYMFIFSKGVPKTFNPLYVQCKFAGNQKNGTYRLQNGELKKCNGADKPIKTMKIKSNIWSYFVGPIKDKIAHKHPAIFPERLAEDHILSWSNPGDLVLDPMAGSGTTLKMAKKNGRNYIGIEVSQSYVDDIINPRLALV
jgi:site-specific DNA-methyltransferase (adenine-specific)